MAEALDEAGMLLQNLRDAGCGEEMIARCMEQAETADIIPMLQTYRSQLLGRVHESQDELDCLDYLLYRLKKGKS